MSCCRPTSTTHSSFLCDGSCLRTVQIQECQLHRWVFIDSYSVSIAINCCNPPMPASSSHASLPPLPPLAVQQVLSHLGWAVCIRRRLVAVQNGPGACRRQRQGRHIRWGWLGRRGEVTAVRSAVRSGDGMLRLSVTRRRVLVSLPPERREFKLNRTHSRSCSPLVPNTPPIQCNRAPTVSYW